MIKLFCLLFGHNWSEDTANSRWCVRCELRQRATLYSDNWRGWFNV